MNPDPEGTPRLGPGTSFEGVLSFEGTLRVDGKLAGTVHALSGALVVGEQAQVEARVEVAELVLAGTLTGDVVAHRRVELLSGASLTGNVTSPRLAIADGGRLSGRCATGGDALSRGSKSS